MTPPSVWVACVHLAPWPLTLLNRQHPGLPVAVLEEGTRRVQFANPLALALGVTPGLREHAALSRCPELHAESMRAPTLNTEWRGLTELLYARFSDRVYVPEEGLAFLALSEGLARELATSLHAPVGLADSQEVAHLAALRARPGEVRVVGEGRTQGQRASPGGRATAIQAVLQAVLSEDAFLALTPTAHLDVLGLPKELLPKLSFLGIRGLGDLLGWSAAQRSAFLGTQVASRLSRFVRGERTTAVPRWTPGEVQTVSLGFDAPLVEPGEVDAALLDLTPGLWAGLRGRTCSYLTVTAHTLGGQLTATRRLKWPLEARGLTRIARLALDDTHALELGIDQLDVQLSGFQQASRQVGLWAGLDGSDAVRAVLERYPRALVRLEWRDVHSYARDARYAWVDWLTGEERPGRMAPARPALGVPETHRPAGIPLEAPELVTVRSRR